MSVAGIADGRFAMANETAEKEVEAVWLRARPISGRDPALYRIAPDVIQSVIRRDQYGICGEYGWRIECGKPVAYRTATTESAIRALEYESINTPSRPIAGNRGN